MRVLFSSTGGYGHVLPLLPLARAFAAAGHDVALATAGSWRDRAESEGFVFLPAGPDLDTLEALGGPHRQALQALPIEERRPHAFTHRFGVLEAPRRLDDVRSAATGWRPDLLVFESGDLAAPLVAAELGLASAHHGFGRMVPLACFRRAAAETEPLWRAAGLEPQALGGVFGGVYVDICPPSLAPEGPPAGVRVERLRPAAAGTKDGDAPEWLRTRRRGPLVYVTLGTIANELPLFRLLLAAAGTLPCDVLVTVGDGPDLAALEPVPPNARVERFVPQDLVLPHAAVVVSHGGSGSTLGALAHGLPMLLVPQGADQFENAAACEAAGAATVLLPDALEVGAVAAAVATLLEEPSYGVQARRIAAEIAAMPAPGELVPKLEAYAAAPTSRA